MAKRKRGGGGGGGRYRDNNNRQGGGGYNRGPGQGRRNRGGGRRRGYGGGQQQDRQDRPDFEPSENGESLPLVAGSGVLEMHPNGYGFLRNPQTNFTRERTDPFVPGTMIEKFGLREGILISGMVQPHRRGQG